MGPHLDEVRLRQLLDDMTSGQPDAPPDRYLGVRRRVTRRRWAMAGGSLVLAAAVAASGIGIGLSVGSLQAASGSRQVPGWALPWPDLRNGSVPQRVLDRAVIAWRHTDPAAVIPPGRVIWYVGQTVASGQDVVVVFEADSPAGPRLVSGVAAASGVMHGQPAWSGGTSPWVTYSVPAPPPRVRTLAIGVNVRGTIAAPGQQPANTIVELTGPAVHTLVVLTPHPAGEAIAAYSTAGMLIHDVGQVTDRVQVSAQLSSVSSRVRFRNAVPVGLPGSPASEVPELALPAPLTHLGSFLAGISGQGNQYDDFKGIHPPPAGRVVARCYGPAPLRVAINGNMRVIGTIPCDGAQHELALRGRQQQTTWLQVLTSDLTSYRVALVRH